MKFLRLTFLMALIGGLSLITSCNKGSDPEPTIQETNLKLMSKTWTIKEVKYNSNDRTTEYTGMKLTIAGTFNATTNSYDYTVTNKPAAPTKSPWPNSGKWSFSTAQPATLITRTPDNLSMTYGVTTTELQLSFTYAGAGFRTSAVEGNWIFIFN